MNYEIECWYSSPVDYLGNIPTEGKTNWNFADLNCLGTSTNANGTPTIELIENTTTGASFWIRQEVSYGDVLVITFLLLFLIFGILQFLTNFLVPKLINFKRK